MNKKIKILSVLNLISYMIIFSMNFVFDFNDLSNINKFIVGSLPLVLIMITSFIFSDDFYADLKVIKVRGVLDWIVRIIAFTINSFIIMDYLQKNYLLLILLLFLCNIIIEIGINKKLKERPKELINNKVEISYKEKCNLGVMVKSTSSLLSSFLVFAGGALSVSTLKNMEGTERSGYVPVILSLAVAIWFIKNSYKKYIDFYLDRNQAKKLFIKNSILAILGYLICLGLSFVKFKVNIQDYVFFIGILFLVPTIKTIRKMSLRLKEIRESMGKEDYDYFVTREFLQKEE